MLGFGDLRKLESVSTPVTKEDKRRKLIHDTRNVVERIRKKAAAALSSTPVEALQKLKTVKPEQFAGPVREAVREALTGAAHTGTALLKGLFSVVEQLNRPGAAGKAFVLELKPLYPGSHAPSPKSVAAGLRAAVKAFKKPETVQDKKLIPAESLPKSLPSWLRKGIQEGTELAFYSALDPSTYIGVGPVAKAGTSGLKATERSAKAVKLVRHAGAKALRPAPEVETYLKFAGKPVANVEPVVRHLREVWRAAVTKSPEPVKAGVNRLVGMFRHAQPQYGTSVAEHRALSRMLPRLHEQLQMARSKALLAGKEALSEYRQMGLTAKDGRLVPYYIESTSPNEFLNKIEPELRPLVQKAADIYSKNMNEIGNILKQEFGDDYINLIDRYVTHIYKDSPTKVKKAVENWRKSRLPGTSLPFAKERAIPTLQEAKKAGLHPVEDIAVIDGVYRGAAANLLHMKRTTDWLERQGLITTGLKPGWIEGSRYAPWLFGKFVHPEVARVFETLKPVIEFRSDELKAIDNAFRKVTSLWKGLVTAVRPGFHIVNNIGNILLLRMAGIPYHKIPQLVGDAIKTMASRKPEDVKTLRLFEQYGLREQGIFHDITTPELRKQLENAWLKMTGKPLTRVARIITSPLQSARQLGELEDAIYRLGAFKYFLDQGFAPQQAARLVKQYLFDYSRLTPVERAIRTYLVPFYAWTRFAIPRSLMAVLEAPGVYTGYTRLQQTTAQQAGVKQEELPDWMQGMIVLGKDDEDKIIYLNPQTIWSWAYPLIGKNFGVEAGRFIGQMLHPAFRAGGIMAYGVDPVTGQRIDRPTDSHPAINRLARALRVIGPVWELEKAHVVEPVGKSPKVTSTALPGVAGVLTSPVGKFDQPLDTAYTLKRAEETIDQYLRDLREEGKTPPTVD